MQRPVDLVIHGGKVVFRSIGHRASVAIRGETIVAVGQRRQHAPATALRRHGLHVRPRGSTATCIFAIRLCPQGRLGQRPRRRRPAAASPQVFDMRIRCRPTGSVEALALKLRNASISHVDFGIHALLDENNIDQLDA